MTGHEVEPDGTARCPFCGRDRETVTLPTEEQMRAMRRARLEYTDTHGGWMNAESRAELDALRAAD